jgi:hypothetical protein
MSARHAAILLLPIALAACAGGDESRSITYTDDRGVANQPYPTNYRAEILAFMKTWLNNPVGVRDAVMAEPVQRTVGGRLRYVSCLRFATRDSRPRERRRALCRRGLCAVSGAGKDDALAADGRRAVGLAAFAPVWAWAIQSHFSED